MVWALAQLSRQLGPCAIPRFSAIRLWLISSASCLSCRACCAISSLATLEVMMKMASLQSMVFPFPSVSRPWEGAVSTVRELQAWVVLRAVSLCPPLAPG